MGRKGVGRGKGEGVLQCNVSRGGRGECAEGGRGGRRGRGERKD